MRAFVLRMSAFAALTFAIAATTVAVHLARGVDPFTAVFPIAVAVLCGWAAAEFINGANQQPLAPPQLDELYALLVEAEMLAAACPPGSPLQARASRQVELLQQIIAEEEGAVA